MNNYFANCKTHEEAKKLYRKLAFKLHPDRDGGSESAFQELNRQYQAFCEGGNSTDSNGQQPRYDWKTDIVQILSQLNLKIISPQSPIADIAQNNIASRLCDLLGIDGTKIRTIENVAKNMIKNEN